jgi:plastin-1
VQKQIATFRDANQGADALVTNNKSNSNPAAKKSMDAEELHARAGRVIGTGRRMGAKAFLRPNDICNGNTKLNLAFVAQIFNVCPGLKATETEIHEMAGLLDDDEGDSREERSFRMWLNSLKLGEKTGLDADGNVVILTPPIHINNLFTDACDGLIILHALDKVHKGCVQWKRVNVRRPISRFQAVENCNYAVTIATSLRYSMVNIGVLDIQKGNKKLILGLVWQMMRCHLLQILASLLGSSSPTPQGGSLNHTHSVTRRGSLGHGSRNPNSIDEGEIVAWANRRVQLTGTTASMRDFKDKSLGSGVFLLELLQAIAPGSLNPALCHNLDGAQGGHEAMAFEEKKNNARYVISVARKLGATVFCTWEDIVEVKPKMMTALIACLMLHDRKKQKSFKKQVKTLARKHSTEVDAEQQQPESERQSEQQPEQKGEPATSEP